MPQRLDSPVTCQAQNKDGSPCRKTGTMARDGFCFTHWAIRNGQKPPWAHRKPRPKKTKADKALVQFGMTAREVERLRKMFPELSQISAKSGKDVLKTLHQVLALRVVANPKDESMRALITLTKFLETPNNAIDEKQTTDRFDLFNVES